MADITVAEFRERFDEFADLADTLVSDLIGEAYGLSDTSRRATLYCVAHLCALESEHTGAPDGGAGVVSSEEVADRKVTYRTQSMKDRDVFFEATSYGRRMLAIESRTPQARMRVVVA